jgi:hypothetical protein
MLAYIGKSDIILNHVGDKLLTDLLRPPKDIWKKTIKMK